jgi:hypothetical protein
VALFLPAPNSRLGSSGCAAIEVSVASSHTTHDTRHTTHDTRHTTHDTRPMTRPMTRHDTTRPTTTTKTHPREHGRCRRRKRLGTNGGGASSRRRRRTSSCSGSRTPPARTAGTTTHIAGLSVSVASCVSCARVSCHTLAPSQVHRVELRLAGLKEVPRMFGTTANESSFLPSECLLCVLCVVCVVLCVVCRVSCCVVLCCVISVREPVM